MNRKITAYLLTFFIVSLVFSVSAADLYNAAGDLPTTVPKNPEETTETPVQEEKPEQMAAPTSCKDIQEVIDNKILKYTAMKPDITANFESMEIKLAGYVEKATVLGYDTTALESNIQELNTLTKVFPTKLEAFQRQLRASRAYACGSTEEAYVESLVQSKKALLEVRESIENIKDYYQKDIRNSILVLSQGGTANE